MALIESFDKVSILTKHLFSKTINTINYANGNGGEHLSIIPLKVGVVSLEFYCAVQASNIARLRKSITDLQ